MSFSVFLQSVNGTADVTLNNGLVTYNIDWGATPQHDGKYEVTFNFVSRQVATTTTDQVFIPVVNWGAIHDVFAPTTANGTPSTLGLGVVRSYVVGTNGNYIAEGSLNVPVILEGKPTQNQFQVSLIGIGNVAFTGMGTVAYMLSIHFKAIGRNA